MMKPNKSGLKDKLNAAMERVNAGRQAKLTAKSEVAYNQGNAKKGAKLEMRSKKVALRSEKRQAISDAKSGKIPVVQPYKKEGINTLKQVMSEKTRTQIPADISNKLMEFRKSSKNK